MASRSRLGLVSELWQFMKVRKKWWLAPILIVLGLLSLLIVFTDQELLFVGSLLFTVIWLVWAGFELRRGPMKR